MHNNFFRNNYKRLIITIILLCLLVISFFCFENGLHNKIVSNSESYIISTEELLSKTFELKIDDQLVLLDPLANYFSHKDFSSPDLFKNINQVLYKNDEYKNIIVVDNINNRTSLKEIHHSNLINDDLIKKTIETKSPQLSNKLITDADRNNYMAICIPINQRGQIIGEVIGELPVSIFEQLLITKAFDNTEVSFIVNNEGEILIGREKIPNINFTDNILNFFINCTNFKLNIINEIKNKISENESSLYSFKYNNNKYLVAFTPIKFSNLYLFTIINDSFVSKKQNVIMKNIRIFSYIIGTIFIIMVILIYQILQQSEAAKNAINKFSMAYMQNKSLVFEYNFEKQEITFSGNTEYVLGTKKNTYSLQELKQKIQLVHPEDGNLANDFQKFFEACDKDIEKEFRYRCAGEVTGQYIWYHLRGTTTFSQGKPYSFVGNIQNINDQVIHEIELKQIAQTDMLSGLLNKSFFQAKVNNYLKSSKEFLCALYIIDLDNFKTTNDTLGHTMGDMAIRDTGKKLSLVFSEKDFTGRIGGDEFCVFLRLSPSTKEEKALKIIKEKAETICNILNEEYFNDKNYVEITASVGVAVAPLHGQTYSELFQKADNALYFVKHNGKNNYKIFTDDLEDHSECVYADDGTIL